MGAVQMAVGKGPCVDSVVCFSAYFDLKEDGAFPKPPSYNVATTLPSYDEAERTKAEAGAVPVVTTYFYFFLFVCVFFLSYRLYELRHVYNAPSAPMLPVKRPTHTQRQLSEV